MLDENNLVDQRVCVFISMVVWATSDASGSHEQWSRGSNPGAGKANQTFHSSGVDKLVAANIAYYCMIKLTV